ncbi:carbohydrate esterase family 8 protein [Clavulina sp. PMI_390]|nr:carbohydrate esterase family 8 protein [Clavulina sp. PMI_390]
MWTLFHLATLITSAASALAASSPPSGAITIGSGGKYSTISAALADTSSNTYFIYAGSYHEQVYINRAGVKIYGQTSNALTYSSNTVTIWNSLNSTVAGSDDASGTVRVGSSGTSVSLYNLNIVNTFGKGSQAISLSVRGNQFGGYGLNVTGYQDTLYVISGNQFYSESLIVGATDYVFGAASVWITKSVFDSIGSGCITASSRSSADSTYYVINSSTVTGSSGVTSYLGRPWRDYARVIYQYCSLSSVVPAAGWSVWSSSDPDTDFVTYAEYDNTGAGASGTRASFSSKLSAPIAISTVLGSTYTSWVDSAYL